MPPPVSTIMAAVGATDFDPTAGLFVAQDRRPAQAIEPLAQPDRWLDASAGAPTAHRFVMLIGRD